MHSNDFDAVASTAAHRRSLYAIGGIGLITALTSPFDAGAKPKPGKVAKKKVKAKCKAQVGQCAAVWDGYCDTKKGPTACKAVLLPCCGFLEQCDAGAMTECLVEVLTI